MKKLMEMGRSMVEMLGVLAIIGVLSIVGIQGYKKAMLKHKANELMNYVSLVYNQTLVKAMTAPSNIKANDLPSAERTAFRDQYRLFLISSSSSTSANAGMNMGMDRPSFMTSNYFNIGADLVPSNSLTYADQTYHLIYFYGMNGNCDLCEALRSMTEKSSGVDRLIPGSNSSTLSGGIHVRCYPGSNGSSLGPKGDAIKDSCWQSTDPD